MSAFFAAKAKVVEQTFKGYSSDIVEELRYVALLTKGGHSLSRVENRMQILAHYVNNGTKTSSKINLIETEN